MNKIVLSSIVMAAGLAASAQAQTQWTFEMRLSPDGTNGSSGPNAATTFNIGDPSNVTVSRIGFWLQARVSQTGDTNWGITRASSPNGGAAFISVADPSALTSISRGAINGSASAFGRGNGYRNGGAATGNTGNTAGNAPFPGGAGNENGGLDNGGAGVRMTRVYSFDAYVGALRASPSYVVDDGGTPGDPSDDIRADVIDPATGNPANPWAVNGAGSPATQANPNPATPVATGAFSPWANLYRVYVDISSIDVNRTIVMSTSLQLNGSVQAAPSSVGGNNWAMQLSPGQVLTASYTFQMAPTPGAAAVIGLGGLAAMRRRR